MTGATRSAAVSRSFLAELSVPRVSGSVEPITKSAGRREALPGPGRWRRKRLASAREPGDWRGRRKNVRQGDRLRSRSPIPDIMRSRRQKGTSAPVSDAAARRRSSSAGRWLRPARRARPPRRRSRRPSRRRRAGASPGGVRPRVRSGTPRTRGPAQVCLRRPGPKRFRPSTCFEAPSWLVSEPVADLGKSRQALDVTQPVGSTGNTLRSGRGARNQRIGFEPVSRRFSAFPCRSAQRACSCPGSRIQFLQDRRLIRRIRNHAHGSTGKSGASVRHLTRHVGVAEMISFSTGSAGFNSMAARALSAASGYCPSLNEPSRDCRRYSRHSLQLDRAGRSKASLRYQPDRPTSIRDS